MQLDSLFSECQILHSSFLILHSLFFIGLPDKYSGSLLLDIMSPFAHTLRHAQSI